MNTLVFHNWSVSCFPCLRGILFALGWSMFRTCFHPEESLYLNKFCSLPTADVESNVIGVRMFFFFPSVSLCHSSFIFFYFASFHFIHFSIGQTNDHHYYKILLSHCFMDLYYHFCFLIIYFVNSTGISLYKGTNSYPKWPYFLSNTRLLCYVTSSGWRKWISMIVSLLENNAGVLIYQKLQNTTGCMSENWVAVFSVRGGAQKWSHGKNSLRAGFTPSWAGRAGWCRNCPFDHYYTLINTPHIQQPTWLLLLCLQTVTATCYIV